MEKVNNADLPIFSSFSVAGFVDISFEVFMVRGACSWTNTSE